MPNERNTAHRIAQGWITTAALNAGAYLVTSLPVASDQIVDNFTLIPWLAPIHPSEVPIFADKDITLPGIVKQYGFRQLHWKFSYWTFGMTAQWLTFYTDPSTSQQVTIGTYDPSDTFAAYQCYMSPLRFPVDSGQAYYGGWNDVIVEFLGGTPAP